MCAACRRFSAVCKQPILRRQTFICCSDCTRKARIHCWLTPARIQGVVGDTYGLTSVMEGASVPLNTDVTKQEHDTMRWYFNDTLIALINGKASKSCLYDGEGGIFSGRLEVDYETGSLTITNITNEHTGRYEANFVQSKSSGTSLSLNRKRKCDSTKIIRKTGNTGDIIKTFRISVSGPDKTNKELYEKDKEQESDMNSVWTSVLIAVGVCVAVVLLVFAAVVRVIYYRCRRSTKDVEKSKHECLLEQV